MNKKMREILAEIETKREEAKAFMEGETKDRDKFNACMDEIDDLEKAFYDEKRLFDSEKTQSALNAVDPIVDPVIDTDVEPKTVTGEEMIAKQVKAIMAPNKYGTDKDLVETTAEDGGYTVPEDIQTKVNQYKDAEFSFMDLISEENVATNKGSRTYQVKGETDAFVDLDENGALTDANGKIASPKFTRVNYAIKDRAGFMPVSNDLINDSDANISATVTDWLGKANIATVNAKVIALIGEHKNPLGNGKYETTKGAKAIDGINGIKKIVNVILGQAYKGGAKIVTNDDGLNYLDTLEDANGRPLLNPDPTDSAKLQLRCGTVVVPVKVIPNKVLKTTDTKVPFIVGDLYEAIRRYNRQKMSIEASSVATIGSFNAFAQNMTLIRAILRDDYKELDKDAYVNGYIDIATASTEEQANG